MTDADTTTQQLEWIIERLTAEAGLTHPDDDAPDLEPWTFPDSRRSAAHARLNVAKCYLRGEREASADQATPDQRGPRLGAHAFLTRQEYDALVADKGFRAVASASLSRAEARQFARWKATTTALGR